MVIPSWCPSVTTRYRLETGRDRDFGFSPYNSLESLVFCDQISCCWVKGVPSNEGEKEGHPFLKKTLVRAICSFSVKMVVDRHSYAA